MKICEKIVEGRLRLESTICEERFGSMTGKSKADVIFALRQTMEKYREIQKGLHLVFIDLEKKPMIWYLEGTTQVRSTVGTPEKFKVKVGLQQDSAFSPYVFDIVMDVITSEVIEEVP
ncbi:uncharacterized protein [Palaemon carinicauda]|uniref:uncharacterized protein n=1 Tax=Palaemon carinicauda TaxID=392227 RepID=UPI0035B6096D